MNAPVQVRLPFTKQSTLLVHTPQIAAIDVFCPTSPLYTAEETLCREQPSWIDRSYLREDNLHTSSEQLKNTGLKRHHFW